ncbi:MAG: hypothetical protein ACRDZ4_01775 [Egibacteraceae bacterium]
MSGGRTVSPVLTIVVPPEPPPIDPMGGGSYAAPTMWDEDEWASPTPCCLGWVVLPIAALEVEGRLDVGCRVCGRAWEVVWDPRRPDGHDHAVWVVGQARAARHS